MSDDVIGTDGQSTAQNVFDDTAEEHTAMSQNTTDDVIMNCDDVTDSVADVMEEETDVEEEKSVDDDITCQTCFESFTSEADFQIHQLQHQLENPFKCAICNDAFPRAELLTKHIQKHQSELKATKPKSVSKAIANNKPTVNLAKLGKMNVVNNKSVKSSIRETVKNTKFPIATVRKSTRKRKPVQVYQYDDLDDPSERDSTEFIPVTETPDYDPSREENVRPDDDVTSIDDVTTHEPASPQTSSPSKVVYVAADASDMADSVKCDRCKQAMYSKYHLLVHLESCDGSIKEKKGRKSVKIKCPYCNRVCTEWFLKHHVGYYHPEKTGDEKPEPVLEFPKEPTKKNQPEKCKTCLKTCMSPWHLKIHMQIHERQDSMGLAITGKKVKVYPCPDCSRVFIYKGSWQLHRKHHHLSNTRYPCDMCDKTFISPLGLTQHKLLHNEEWPYSCDICDKRFKRKDAIWTHKKRKHQSMLGESTQKRSYFCSLCQDVFPSDHKKTHHEFDESGTTKRKCIPEKVMCELCGKWYCSKHTLKMHVESVHERQRKYPCDICGQKFLASQALRTHRKTHSSERPYLCDTCGKSFGNRAQLLKHGAVHVTVKAFTCETCEKGFASQMRLNRHKTIHLANRPLPERKYACDVCGRTFTMRRYLRDHEATHYGEGDRPFNCVICGRRFAQEMDLEAHNLDHDGHRKIDCPDCPNIHFKSSERFHFHLREIHGKEPDPRILALIEARKNHAKSDHSAKPVQNVYRSKRSRGRVPNTSQVSTTSADSSYHIDAVLNKASTNAPEAHQMTTLTFLPGNVGGSGSGVVRAPETHVDHEVQVPQITPGAPANYGIHYSAGYWATVPYVWDSMGNGK